MFNGGYEFFYKERVASFSSNTIYAAGTLITLEAPANSISNWKEYL
jgi:hypothetical protein